MKLPPLNTDDLGEIVRELFAALVQAGIEPAAAARALFVHGAAALLKLHGVAGLQAMVGQLLADAPEAARYAGPPAAD